MVAKELMDGDVFILTLFSGMSKQVKNLFKRMEKYFKDMLLCIFLFLNILSFLIQKMFMDIALKEFLVKLLIQGSMQLLKK
jgi:hypothetical protein